MYSNRARVVVVQPAAYYVKDEMNGCSGWHVPRTGTMLMLTCVLLNLCADGGCYYSSSPVHSMQFSFFAILPIQPAPTTPQYQQTASHTHTHTYGHAKPSTADVTNGCFFSVSFRTRTDWQWSRFRYQSNIAARIISSHGIDTLSFVDDFVSEWINEEIMHLHSAR